MSDNKRKFNIVDVVLIAVILLFAAAIVGKIMYPDFFRTKPQTVTVSCVLKTDADMSPYAVALKVGDKIYIHTDVLLGTITEINTEETVLPLAEEGEEPETGIEYTVTAVCDLSVESGAYRTSDGTAITAGSVLDINTKDTLCMFYVEKMIETNAKG